MRPAHIYKIFQLKEWMNFRNTKVFKGSPVDLVDGFIHLSCARQLQGTLDKHYRDNVDVVVGEVSAAKLGESLKYEVSRGGEDFPHLYGDLAMDAVTRHWPLSPDKWGRYAVCEILPGESL